MVIIWNTFSSCLLSLLSYWRTQKGPFSFSLSLFLSFPPICTPSFFSFPSFFFALLLLYLSNSCSNLLFRHSIRKKVGNKIKRRVKLWNTVFFVQYNIQFEVFLYTGTYFFRYRSILYHTIFQKNYLCSKTS